MYATDLTEIFARRRKLRHSRSRRRSSLATKSMSPIRLNTLSTLFSTSSPSGNRLPNLGPPSRITDESGIQLVGDGISDDIRHSI